MAKILEPPFKDERGRWLTAALFFELWRDVAIEDRYLDQPVFTLYDDRPGCINARTTFVALEDPTGYQWAMQYLGSWLHFQRLMKSDWFVEAFNSWLEELETKLASEAVVRIKAIAGSDSPQAIVASKYLAERGWERKAANRGRPSKAELKGELKRQAQRLEVHVADGERIGLKAIIGGKS